MTDSEDSKPEIEKKEEEEEMEENKTSDAEKEEEGDKSGEEKDEEEKKEYKKKDVKQETSVSKKTSTPAKKAPKKAEKKDKSDDDESGSEDDEDEEQKVGIYDKPVVLEEGAKRERKKVERLSATFTKTEEKPFEVPKGKGISLGECGFIDFKLNRTLADDLKPLHRLIFKRAGSAFEIKKNLRKFSGFPFGKNDKEYESRKNALTSKSYTTVMIKFMCDVLDIPRSGKKEEMIDRLMEFLLKPTDSGRKVPKSKRKGKSDEKKKGSKKAKGNKPEGKKKKKKEGDEEEDEEEEDEEEEDEEEEEENEEEEEEEEESEVEEPPKKKMKVTKTPKKEKEEKKEKPKKKETKKAAKKAKIESTDEDESDASSDDEPLVKKSDGPPSNEEIREVIKKILDSANLEMVTMKTVVKDVFAKYPKHDLSDRKDFIKNTVRQLIS